MKIHAILSGIIVLMISFVSGDKLDLSVPCTSEKDCRSMQALPSDAFCEDGRCMCPSSDSKIKICLNASLHQLVPKRKGPLVYRTCKHNQDCAFFQGVCNTTNSQCDCAKGYVASSNHQHCVEVVQSMNANCTDKNQCIAFLANTTCARNNTCVCKSGYRYEDNVCLKLPEYGQSCVKDEECPRIEGVVCVNHTVCECRSETVLSANGEQCLPVVKNILTDNCTESVQCTARFQHSNCTDNTCRCDPGYHYANDPDQCIVTKAIDEDCTNEYECYQTEDDTNDSPNKSLICAANKCTCAADYYRQENRCVNNGSSVATSFPVYVFVFVSLITLICGSLFS